MMDDFHKVVISGAALGLFVAATLIYSTGFDGRFAGLKIGPSKPWLMVAGR